MAEPIGDARIQAEIDAAWAAHEGDREPGISDLDWSQNTGRRLVEGFTAGRAADAAVRIRRASDELRDRQSQVVVDDERKAA